MKTFKQCIKTIPDPLIVKMAMKAYEFAKIQNGRNSYSDMRDAILEGFQWASAQRIGCLTRLVWITLCDYGYSKIISKSIRYNLSQEDKDNIDAFGKFYLNRSHNGFDYRRYGRKVEVIPGMMYRHLGMILPGIDSDGKIIFHSVSTLACETANIKLFLPHKNVKEIIEKDIAIMEPLQVVE